MSFSKKLFAFYFLIPLSLLSFSCKAQNTEKWGISANTFGGFLWAHTPEVSNLKAHIYGSSLDFRVMTANRKVWHREYNRPAWGVRLYYAYLGKPNIAGSALAVLPYIDLPVISKYSWRWSLRGTSGLGYITQPFDVTGNTINRTIASHLNVNMSLHGVINKFLTPELELVLTGGLTHFSNGNFKQPNLGINLFDASIGLTYYAGKKQVTAVDEKPFNKNNKEWLFAVFAGNKSTGYLFPRQVTPVSFQTKLLYNVTSKSKLGGGIDIFYDVGNFYAANSREKVKHGFANALEVGTKISYELKISRLSFITDVGIYAYNRNEVKRFIYQQIGFRWRATQQISLYSLLKAHFDSADFISVGVGYILSKN